MGRRIGIRLANGAFFDLLSDDTPESRKLRLNSVRDGQTFFYVELFSSATGTMADAVFLLKLELDGLSAERDSKSPIVFSIKSDGCGRIAVSLSDEESGKNASVTAQIPDLPEKEAFDEKTAKIARELSWRDKISKRYRASLKSRKKKSWRPRSFGVLPMAICVLCMIISIVALYFSISRPKAEFYDSADEESEVLPDEVSKTMREKNKVVVFSDANVLPQMPRQSERDGEIARHKVVLGDNLHDIAFSYYKSAFFSQKLAKANGIENPDFVAAGKWILIPAVQ